MTLAGEELDSVPVEPHRLKQEGYLEAMVHCLRRKHQRQLLSASALPLFYLEAGSRMNDADLEGST